MKFLVIFGLILVSFKLIFAEEVCSVCRCADSQPYVIDCSGLNIDSVFSASSWAPFKSKESIEVNFDRNKFTELPQFDLLPVVKLSFRGNLISSLHNSTFSQLEKLGHLDLSENELTTIAKGAFEGLRNLKTLKLSSNQISTLDKNVFDSLSQLEWLNLDNNPMEVIDHYTSQALSTLVELRHLDLAETGIINIPEGLLLALPELTTLIVSNNRFKSVPKELQSSKRLQFLNLNGNLIKELDGESFRGLKNLKQLNISYMPKLELINRGTFSLLNSLEVLHCSFNPKLQKIHSRSFTSTDGTSQTLKQFYFQGNSIESFPRTLLKWTSLSVIDIRDNPLNCNCSNALWLKDDLLPVITSRHSDFLEQITCGSPDEVRGSLLQSALLTCDPNQVRLANFTEEEDAFFDEESVLDPNTESSTNSVVIIVAIAGTVALVAGLLLLGYLGLRKRKMALRNARSTQREDVSYVRTPAVDPEAQTNETVRVLPSKNEQPA